MQRKYRVLEHSVGPNHCFRGNFGGLKLGYEGSLAPETGIRIASHNEITDKHGFYSVFGSYANISLAIEGINMFWVFKKGQGI